MRHPLESRIAALRGQARRQLAVHGLGWLLVGSVAAVAGAGGLDWLIHLVPEVRLALLVAVSLTAAWLLLQHVVAPLVVKFNDLAIAMKIEERWPGLNDRLASTVQFLRQPDDESQGSKRLRDATVAQTIEETRTIDFRQAIDPRPARKAVGWSGLAVGLAALVMLMAPMSSRIALDRLFRPYGSTQWPRLTHLTIVEAETPRKVARGEPFTLAVAVGPGERMPSTARVTYTFADGETSDEALRPADDGIFRGRLETSTRDFSFTVAAGDDATAPYAVKVVPPPTLTALTVKVTPPAYTGLTASTLAPGNTQVRTVIGSRVDLDGTTNKPLATAVLRVGDATTAPVPVTIGGKGTTVAASLPVAASAPFWFELKDTEGFKNQEIVRYDLRSVPDEAPRVAFEEPINDRDVPTKATVPIRIAVDDDFGIHSIRLIYKVATGGSEPAREVIVPLWDGQARPDSPRSKHEVVAYRWDLAPLKLEPGTIITFHADSRDFDNVKGPNIGKSRELRLRIVSDEEILRQIEDQQRALRDEIERTHAMQKQAQAPVADAQRSLKRSPNLPAPTRDNLRNAETIQRQVTSRVASKSDGIEQKVNRILDDIANFNVANPDAERQMRAMRQAVDRIKDQNLTPAEQGLTRAGKALDEQAADKTKPGDPSQSADRTNPTPETPQAGDQTKPNPDGAKPGDQTKPTPDAKDQTKPTPGSNDQTKPNSDRPGERTNPTAPQSKPSDQTKPNPSQPGDQTKPNPDGKPTDQTKPNPGDQTKPTAGDQTKPTPGQPSGDKPGDQTKPSEGQPSGESKPGDQTKPTAGQSGDQTKPTSAQSSGDKSGDQTKPSPAGAQPKADTPSKPTPELALNDAAKNQQAIADELKKMLDSMSEFDTYRGIIKDAKSLLQQQEQAMKQSAEAASKPDLAGKTPEALTPEQKTELENQGARQSEMAKGLQGLEAKMDEMAKKIEGSDPLAASALREAAKQSRQKATAAKMQEGAEQLGKNQMGQARQNQDQARNDLKELVDSVQNRRERELARLVQELKQAEADLKALKARQAANLKKTAEAKKMADPKARAKELQKLAKEQAEIAKEMQRQLQKLAKLGADPAARAAEQAAAKMAKAQQDLNGEKADDAEAEMEDALNNLREAQQELAQNRREAEEQLAMEQISKMADHLKSIAERQKKTIGETTTYEKARAENGGKLSIAQRTGVRDLGRVQVGLKDETGELIERLGEGAPVFTLTLKRATNAMDDAASRLQALKTDEPTLKAEQTAANRFQQLIDSLKPDKMKKAEGDQGDQQGGGGGGGGAGGDGIPASAQIKMLKNLQNEINERTDALDEITRRGQKLTPEQEQELAKLHEDQGALADLVRDMTRPKHVDGEDE